MVQGAGAGMRKDCDLLGSSGKDLEKVPLEQRLRKVRIEIWEKHPGEACSSQREQVVQACLECSKGSKETRVAGV